ncbi:MAG: hypothetical protein IJD46_03575 [Bacilli bacterium]|nr:hypothetical protein [Bacilli bacterium]
MTVSKSKNEYNMYDILIEDGTKKLNIYFVGNLDLYWSLSNINEFSHTYEMLITKENYRIYELFLTLYNDIKNCNVRKEYEDCIERCTSLDELREYKRSVEECNNSLRLIEENGEQRLFKDGVVEWHSDDFAYDTANVLKIIKQDEDSFIIRIESKEKEKHSRNVVRFANSGSRYKWFNVIFMEMYHKLQAYDPEETQIHIEEYMYQKKIGKLV